MICLAFRADLSRRHWLSVTPAFAVGPALQRPARSDMTALSRLGADLLRCKETATDAPSLGTRISCTRMCAVRRLQEAGAVSASRHRHVAQTECRCSIASRHRSCTTWVWTGPVPDESGQEECGVLPTRGARCQARAADEKSSCTVMSRGNSTLRAQLIGRGSAQSIVCVLRGHRSQLLLRLGHRKPAYGSCAACRSAHHGDSSAQPEKTTASQQMVKD